MRVLVCGGRDYDNYAEAQIQLSFIVPEQDFIIEGGARGADRLGRTYAIERGVPHKTYPADWEKYGKSAGFIRNQQMLDEGKPDLVIAFPGGRGTADMISRAEKAGVKVIKIDP